MDEFAVVLGDFGNDIVLEVEVVVEGVEVGLGVNNLTSRWRRRSAQRRRQPDDSSGGFQPAAVLAERETKRENKKKREERTD